MRKFYSTPGILTETLTKGNGSNSAELIDHRDLYTRLCWFTATNWGRDYLNGSEKELMLADSMI